MAKTIYSTIILCFFYFVTFSQSTLRLRNNTAKEIYTSYVVWNNDNECWVSKGWYKIKPYKYEDFDLGNYYGTVYTHAVQHGVSGDIKWGDEKLFCINPIDAFEIYYAGKLNCENTAMFSSLKVSNGVNTYFFHP